MGVRRCESGAHALCVVPCTSGMACARARGLCALSAAARVQRQERAGGAGRRHAGEGCRLPRARRLGGLRRRAERAPVAGPAAAGPPGALGTPACCRGGRHSVAEDYLGMVMLEDGWVLRAARCGRLRNSCTWQAAQRSGLHTDQRGWQCRARACMHPAAGCGRAAARGAGAHAGARRAGRPAPAVPQLAGRPRGRAGAARARPRRVAGGRPGRGACAARGWPAAPAGWGPSLASSVHVLPPQGPATLPVTESC